MKTVVVIMLVVILLVPGPGAVLASDASGPQAQPGTEEPTTSSDRFYVRVLIDNAQDALALARLMPQWDETLAAGSTILTLTADEIDWLRGLGYELLVLGEAPPTPQAWPSCYQRLGDLLSWLEAYEAAHPNLVELFDIGDSWCKQSGGCTAPNGLGWPGYDMWVARLTNELATGPKEGRFFVDSGIHARELPTPELAKAFIELLVGNYGLDPEATWLLDQREIYVMLVTNPDGRRLVEMGVGTEPPYLGNPWQWRKNGNDSIPGSNNCAWPPTAGNHYGVDLNRNHVFKWDASGHSTFVCDPDYRGPSAGSEPEIQTYENFVRSIIADQRGPGDDDPAPLDTTGFLINLHNYVFGGKILVPWGWAGGPSPNDAQLRPIAQKMQSFNNYAWDYSLYPVSGNTRDWGYGELGIPAFVIELDGDGFFTTCSLVPGIIDEMLPVLRYAATIADRPYQRVFGPDSDDVTTSPSSVTAGDSVVLSAQIDDTGNGNQAVAGAEYYVAPIGGGVPGEPGTGAVMAASDGSFNSPVEDVEATISTAGMGRGRYLALVRGLDSDLNWGPFSAQSFEVTCFFADMNCNGFVDVLDIVDTVEAVQTYWTYGAFSAVHDINNGGAGDGILSVADVQTVAGLFDQPAP